LPGTRVIAQDGTGRDCAAFAGIKTNHSSGALRLLPKPAPTTDEDRRVHPRRSREELDAAPAVRIHGHRAVSLVNLSTGGALIETPFQLRPGSRVIAEMLASGQRMQVPLRLLRCYVSDLQRGLWYRAACEFDQALDLPGLLDDVQPAEPVRLLQALEQLKQSFASDPILQDPRFNQLLMAIIATVAVDEPRMLITTRIEAQLRQVFPLMAISNASENRPLDPATTAHFFNLEFRSKAALTRVERHFLRACAQIITLLQPLTGEAARGATTADAENYEIVHSTSDWLQTGNR
jgi:hypothetical protein